MTTPPLGPEAPRRGNRLSRAAGRLVLGGLRWRLEGEVPNVPRAVVILAPHTSNWDFVVGLAAVLALGLRARWLGKSQIFRPPFGFFLRWAGGIPVDRTTPEGVVGQACAALREDVPFFLGLAPEGTRRRVERWKTGFHRIARQAGVAIWPVAFDYRSRVLRFHLVFPPTGDLEADLARLRALYEPAMARHPEGYGG